VRLSLWPLGGAERGLLRILSVWLNPIAWLLAFLPFRRSLTWELWSAIAMLFAIAFLAPVRSATGLPGVLRALPHFPTALDQLIRKNLRETVATLDFYCALTIAAASFGLRCAGALPREALLPMSTLVVLALSTYSANLFGLDSDAGMTRYRLLPIPGWQVLAAKDLAFLLIALALTLPLSPPAGLAGASIGLAIGHYGSVNRRHRDARWRFSTASGFTGALLQMAAIALAAASVVNASVWWLAPCLAIYAWSTWHWGCAMDVSLHR